MKKYLLLICLWFSSIAHAQSVAGDFEITVRNASNTGYNTYNTHLPAGGVMGISIYDPATNLPGFISLGTGCSTTSNVLTCTGAAQVNADWNSVTGLSQILNKPSLSTVAVTGSYTDLINAPAIPTAPVNADWNATTGLAQILNKPTIPQFNFGAINARTISLSTAYQATDNTKAAVVSLSPQCTASISLAGGSTCTIQARVGTNSLTCSSGSVVATWTNGNTGTLTIGLALNQIIGAPGNVNLPIGGYFTLCQTAGTGATITTAVDQSAG